MNKFVQSTSTGSSHQFKSVQKCETETISDEHCEAQELDSTAEGRRGAELFSRLFEQSEHGTVSAFEEERGFEKSRRASLREPTFRQTLQLPERCSYRMSIRLDTPINDYSSQLKYDQLGHYKTSKAVDTAISKLQANNLIGSSESLNIAEVIMTLLMLGYIKLRSVGDCVRQQDIRLVEEFMRLYCSPGENTLSAVQLIAFLCLLEGNDTRDGEFYGRAGRMSTTITQSTPTNGEKQRAQRRFQDFKLTHDRFLKREFKAPSKLNEVSSQLWNCLKKSCQPREPFQKKQPELRDATGQRLYRLPLHPK